MIIITGIEGEIFIIVIEGIVIITETGGIVTTAIIETIEIEIKTMSITDAKIVIGIGTDTGETGIEIVGIGKTIGLIIKMNATTLEGKETEIGIEIVEILGIGIGIEPIIENREKSRRPYQIIETSLLTKVQLFRLPHLRRRYFPQHQYSHPLPQNNHRLSVLLLRFHCSLHQKKRKKKTLEA
jgi:hypothetical protein